jgi:plastocyanin
MTLGPLHALVGATLWLAASAVHAGTVRVQVLDGAGQPLPEAVVFLESREARQAAKPARDVTIAQTNKQFSPSVTVVPVGTAVEFPNRDTVRHHVYSFSQIKPFELKLYAGTPANPVVFDRPGIAVLGCNIHDHMTAWVVVVETPYYARTAAGGRATLEGVPAGNYRLRAWHAGLPVGAPAADEPITVIVGNTAATVSLAEMPK